jgi:hypothetical protein
MQTDNQELRTKAIEAISNTLLDWNETDASTRIFGKVVLDLPEVQKYFALSHSEPTEQALTDEDIEAALQAAIPTSEPFRVVARAATAKCVAYFQTQKEREQREVAKTFLAATQRAYERGLAEGQTLEAENKWLKGQVSTDLDILRKRALKIAELEAENQALKEELKGSVK